MQYGFIIDNRKCIGCHACTTACKSEHEVPVGVNRTWVKYVEKGNFPHTTRNFSVMRCNHCSDAPCVEICPVEALYIREDGIVDFDKHRCIGCKSCMQACPYDALYIDPETSTAAKCNYCAHRVEMGIEPACVVVCPEHAIISGDLDDPNSEISILAATGKLSARKTEKGTSPNLFYINGDESALQANGTGDKSDSYIWSSQSQGVGKYAKYAEKLAFSNNDVIDSLLADQVQADQRAGERVVPRSIDILMDNKPRRVYDVPDKGILWEWEVAGYIWTKAISAGMILLAGLYGLLNVEPVSGSIENIGLLVSLTFLAFTGVLLIKDLERPDRFLYVLLRPQWKSWLVRGGYLISLFGCLLVTSLIIDHHLPISKVIWGLTVLAAIGVAIYTAFLLAQAKGRDYWQNPLIVLHMLNHAVMAGAVGWMILGFFFGNGSIFSFSARMLSCSILANVVMLAIERYIPHATADTRRVVHEIFKGRYARFTAIGVLFLGNMVPLVGLFFLDAHQWAAPLISILVLVGIFIQEHILIEAPQRVSLS